MSAIISSEVSTRVNKPWSFQEALNAFLASPTDVYLNFVLMQLAKRDGREREAAGIIESRLNVIRRSQPRRGDLRQVNLLSLLSGRVGVQECLQIEAMREHYGFADPSPLAQGAFASNGTAADRLSPNQDFSPPASEKRIPFASLAVPDQKSHPWSEMLAASTPAQNPSALSRLMPADFLFAESRSAKRLLETMETICEWGDTISRSLQKKSNANKTVMRAANKLGIDRFLERIEILDSVESAVASSDLFLSEGTDISVLLRFKADDSMSVYLADLSSKRHVRAHRYREHSYDELIHEGFTSFSAKLDEQTFLCSNSQKAAHKILDACISKVSLGNSDEFKYIRTLMPESESADEVLLYFSDPFIHHIVSPKLRVTEHRRISCLANLRLFEYSVLLFRTQFGRNPVSLAEIAERGCLPAAANQGRLCCPCSGTYSLIEEKQDELAFPKCSSHGSASHLIPCIDFDYGDATEAEAAEYTQFVNEYNRYWQNYFDPIGVRFAYDRAKNAKTVETIILPLMQNSIYSGLASVVRNASPANLEDPVTPNSSIFSAAFRFDADVVKEALHANQQASMYKSVLDSQVEALNYRKFLINGVDKQIGFHVIDSEPPFTLDFSKVLGFAVGSMSTNNNRAFGSNPLFLAGAFILTAINSPVYLSIPVLDEAIVDKFCADLSSLLVKVCHHNQVFGTDPYSYKLDDGTQAYCVTISLLAATFRLHWARVGSRLVIASKQSVLTQLSEALHDSSKRDSINYLSPQLCAHAGVRLRQENWNRIKADLDAAAAENNRAICFSNQAPLGNQLRAGLSIKQIDRYVCPCGGTYELDGNIVKCSIHNNPLKPEQGVKHSNERVRAFSAQLAFLEDGLHAKLIMDL